MHVVLGGSGGVGSAVARLLADMPVGVRAVNRSGKIPFLPRRVERRGAEAVALDTLRDACRDAAVIYHCIHPTRDFGLLVPITSHVVQVAAELDAYLIMASSVYPYGRVDGPLTEDMPYRPTGPTGRDHAQAAAIVARAVQSGEVRAAIGRAGHCYGPYVRRAWPGTDIEAALRGKPAKTLGDPDALHSYTFVEDFARGLVALALDQRSAGKVWHVPCAPPIAMRELLTLIYDAARTSLQIEPRNRLVLALLSLVNQEQYWLREMDYQFAKPFIIDHHRFDEAFGDQPTPHHEAVYRTVEWARRLLPADELPT